MTARNLFLPIAGAATVGPMSFGAIIILGNLNRPLLSVLVLALGTLALAAITFKSARPFSLGVLGGYGLLTLVSGGDCTVDFTGDGYGAIAALVAYPALLMLAVGAAAVALFVARRRSDT